MKGMRFWAALAVFVSVLTACDPLKSTAQGAELQGRYVLSTVSEWGGWTEAYTVTDSTVSYESGATEAALSSVYAARIEKAVFGKFNNAEIKLAANVSDTSYDLFGYLIVEYTQANNSGTGYEGAFNVVRFGKKSDGSWVFTQGYKNKSQEQGQYVNDLPSDSKNIEEKITLSGSYFEFASAGFAKK